MAWQGNFVLSRIIDDLNEDNWVTTVKFVDQITTSGYASHEVRRRRGSMDRFNYGTEEEPNWYSNEYLYAALFNEEAVKFARFKNRLVNVFGVPEENVDFYTTTRKIYRVESVTAFFTLSGTDRIAVELLGCPSDTELCSKRVSNREMRRFLAKYALAWGENSA
jgi:hypothetical protein